MLAANDWRYIQSLSSYGSDLRWITRDEPENGLDLLDNPDHPSIIYSLSCDVIPFDSLFNFSQKAGPLPYNMAEGFTVAGDFGGVAFIGNTRTGYDTYNKSMELAFGAQLNNRVPIGMALNLSSTAISYKFSQYTRNLIGDPSLKVWLGTPSPLNLICSTNSTQLVIRGNELAEAKIVVYDGFKPIVYSAGSGVSSLSFNSTEYGNDFLVSVYKDDYVPMLQLYAQNALLTTSKQYILTKTMLKGELDFCYKIKQNGKLVLKCLENFESDKSFEISQGGRLDIEGNDIIKLSNDKICEAGNAVITGKRVVLGSGFTVSKGGTLSILNK